MPLDRTGSLEQPLFQVFKEQLDTGFWCHIFPEGRIWQGWRFSDDEPRLGPLKIGVGKLIAHCKSIPTVLPIYHKGMDNVVPEKIHPDRKSRKPAKPISIVPRFGNQITMYVGKPLDFTDKIRKFDEAFPNQLQQWQSTAEKLELYASITADIKQSLLELEKEAWGRETSSLELAYA